jgi:hypothetical protein
MSADLNSMLQTMIANPGAMEAAATQALLSQFADDDPTANLLATYLSQRNATAQREEQPEEEIESEAAECAAELATLRERSDSSAAAVRELRDRIETLFAELEILRERNDALARALGACALCWGDDVDCPICRGAGRPGFTVPEQRLFTQMLFPAISRFRRRNAELRPFPSKGSHAPIAFESPKGE